MPGKMSLVLIFCFLISQWGHHEFEQYEIDCNLHEKTLFQDIITLTVEYDIAIHLEFTGEISIRYHLRIFQELPHQTLD